jgi:hypothetical protein
MKGKNMDIKKIIGMGILCGLSLDGSAAVQKGEPYYPVTQYNSSNNQYYATNSNDSPDDMGDVLRNCYQRVFTNAAKLAGNNSTKEATWSAFLLSCAWEIYMLFNEFPEIKYQLQQVFNGTMPFSDLQTLRMRLNQQSGQCLEWVQIFLEQFLALSQNKIDFIDYSK